jgi:hypothetical protein
MASDLHLGAPRGIRTPNRQIRSLVLCVDLAGSRPIWPGHVGSPVGPDGSTRVRWDRLDDQPDDQSPSAVERIGCKASRSPRHLGRTVGPWCLSWYGRAMAQRQGTHRCTGAGSGGRRHGPGWVGRPGHGSGFAVGTVTGGIFQRGLDETYGRCSSPCRVICRPATVPTGICCSPMLTGRGDSADGSSKRSPLTLRTVVQPPAAGTARWQAEDDQPNVGSVVAAQHQRGREEQHRDDQRLDN